MHDFGVQFSDFSPQGLENGQLSFSFCVKVNFILPVGFKFVSLQRTINIKVEDFIGKKQSISTNS